MRAPGLPGPGPRPRAGRVGQGAGAQGRGLRVGDVGGEEGGVLYESRVCGGGEGECGAVGGGAGRGGYVL